MKQNVSAELLKYSRRIAIAIVASGVIAAPAVRANPSNNIVLVTPADLPELARQGGEAMLLRETSGGRTLLYIEQNQGSRLAAFDVTDPVHVKGAGSVQLASSAPFDFVSPVGKQAELIRFRQGQEEAVLDLHKGKVVEATNPPGLDRILDVKEVHEELTNEATGTTFLLTQKGLYLVRRPALEWNKREREQEWFYQHAGG
jgi:hypothetical protein